MIGLIDLILAGVNIGFIPALLPTVLGKGKKGRSSVPLTTSLTYVGLLAAEISVYVFLGFYLAAGAGVLRAALWLLIAWHRHGTHNVICQVCNLARWPHVCNCEPKCICGSTPLMQPCGLACEYPYSDGAESTVLPVVGPDGC